MAHFVPSSGHSVDMVLRAGAGRGHARVGAFPQIGPPSIPVNRLGLHAVLQRCALPCS